MRSAAIFLALLAPGPDSSGPPPRRTEIHLSFDFKDVPVEMVLRHVATATGWVFVLERRDYGRIDAVSGKKVPISKCLDFLNAVLRSKGAVILNPRSPALPKPGDLLKVVETGRAARSGN